MGMPVTTVSVAVSMPMSVAVSFAVGAGRVVPMAAVALSVVRVIVPVAFVMPRLAVRVVVSARVSVVRVIVLVVICPSHRRLPRQLSASAAI